MGETEITPDGEAESSGLAQRLLLCCACVIVCAVLLPSCSLPRIIVIDDPLSPEEHINLGVAYEKKGETSLAIEEYKKASRKLPVAFLYMGNAYFQKGALSDAERYYRKAIEKEPGLASAYNNLAWLYCTKGENLAEAEALASRAVELNPSEPQYGDTLNRIRELRAGNGL